MRSLRFEKLWLAVGWLLVAAVIYLSLTPYPPETIEYISDKAYHAFAYFVLMFWFVQIYSGRRNQYYLAGAIIGLGMVLEPAQSMTGNRHGEVLDAVANSIGVLAAWSLARMGWVDCLTWMERRVGSR